VFLFVHLCLLFAYSAIAGSKQSWFMGRTIRIEKAGDRGDGVADAKNWKHSIEVVKRSQLLPVLCDKPRYRVDVVIRRNFGEMLGMDIVGGADNDCGPVGVHVVHITPDSRKFRHESETCFMLLIDVLREHRNHSCGNNYLPWSDPTCTHVK
jgi:hypothetical protein